MNRDNFTMAEFEAEVRNKVLAELREQVEQINVPLRLWHPATGRMQDLVFVPAVIALIDGLSDA
jgi:hypothetical protein